MTCDTLCLSWCRMDDCLSNRVPGVERRPRVKAKWRWLYGLNPMVGVIEGIRWSLTGRGRAGPTAADLRRDGTGGALTGVAYFQSVETTMADVV